MKLLFFEWNAFMQKDIERIMSNWTDVTFDCVSYEFKNPDEDSLFDEQFPKWLLRDKYDMVFSLNFFPPVSDVCEKYNIPYVSWVYDAPMNIRKLSSIANHVNTIYVFDGGQYSDLCNMGFTTVKHLPLGVDTGKIASMTFTKADYSKFTSEISFVGKLYSSDYNNMLQLLSSTLQAKLNNIVNEQLVTYSNYFINDKLTDSLLHDINSSSSFTIGVKELEFMMACEVTRRERLLALNELSKTHTIKLYSNESFQCNNIINMGTAKYYSEMPKIFNLSKINLNITLRIIKTGMPLRVLDILGASGFLMSNYQNELASSFIDGKDMVTYSSINELVAKTNYYLAHEDERQQIAVNGRIRAHELFELECMLRKILTVQ